MITGLTIWSVVKVLLIILLLIYIVFSYVIVRQVQLMTDTLVIGFEKQLKFLAFVHFLFAIAVLIFSILIL
jgi:hypothetical protein